MYTFQFKTFLIVVSVYYGFIFKLVWSLAATDFHFFLEKETKQRIQVAKIAMLNAAPGALGLATFALLFFIVLAIGLYLVAKWREYITGQ